MLVSLFEFFQWEEKQKENSIFLEWNEQVIIIPLYPSEGHYIIIDYTIIDYKL